MIRYHHFTVDVEEHFQVYALEPYVERSTWDHLPSRVVNSTRRLLDLLDQHEARGTFFILSWVASRYQHLVRDIVARGHEIASHGTDHRQITQLTPAEFRDSVRESKSILEDIAQTSVLGYRAPSFSIVPGREWALEVLGEEGYVYDSSLFPVRRSGSGYVGALHHPHTFKLASGSILEFPPATLNILGKRLPGGGGAYLRLLPFKLVESALAQSEREGYPGTLYIHPWEVDPDQPRVPVSFLTRIRQYGGLRRTYSRLDRLLERFRFRPIADSLPQAEVRSMRIDSST